MLPRTAVGVALLALTGLAVAQQAHSPAGPGRPAGGAEAAADNADVPLRPRKALAKTPSARLEVPIAATGKLLVKFNDDVRARRLDEETVMSQTGRDLRAFHEILKQNGLTLRPEFTLPDEVLAAIEAKAAVNSGRAQPDLAGMMLVEGPGGLVPVGAAQAINDLDIVEFVEFQQEMVVKGPNGACCVGGSCAEIDAASCQAGGGVFQGIGTTCGAGCGGCCLPPPTGCIFTSEDICTANLGTFLGTFVTCGTDPSAFGACCLTNDNCIVTCKADCDSQGGSFRGDGTTCGGPQCGLCCGDDDTCTEGQTPDQCADLSGTFQGPGLSCDPGDPNFFDCTTTGEPDCGVISTGSCFEPNGSAFCSLEQCCQDVCDFDPFCCTPPETQTGWPQRQSANGGIGGWDVWCASHAIEVCLGGFGAGPTPAPPFHDPNPPAPTPNFTAAQGYLTEAGYGIVLPPDIAPAIPHDTSNLPMVGNPMPGFGGQGFDMQGVWSIGEIVLNSGVGFSTENLTRGKSIKVGVVEHTAFVPSALGPNQPYDHEELTHVVTEPDQPFLITGVGDSSGHHGTATLGIIGSLNQRANGTLRPEGESPADSMTDQYGCVGMAPDCDLYFFSIVSIGGGGTNEAIVRALDPNGANFGPGDVLSFSIGPGGCGTIASSLGGFLTLGVATSAGVTCVISAGNDCCNLDDAPQGEGAGDSGVIIVGACYPGSSDFMSYCRLPYSNYCRTCDAASAVHISAWGWAVATLGYGDMFFGNVPGGGALNRTYTASFGGTSAAAPQIAALCACLQGLAKMLYGIPLTPEQIRSVFLDGDGFDQCAFVDPDDLPGDNDIPFRPCNDDTFIFSNGDWDADAIGNRVGAVDNIAFTAAIDDADDIVKGAWFAGNPHVSGIEILTGTLISGNVFSIKALDGNVLRVRSELTLPQGPGVIHRGDLASGHVTDVMVTGTGQTPVGSMAVTVASSSNIPFGVMVVYLYNFSTDKWRTVGVSLLNGFGVVQTFPLFAVNPSQFVNSSNLEVRARVWTVAVNIEQEYDVFHDLIEVDINTNPFVGIPP